MSDFGGLFINGGVDNGVDNIFIVDGVAAFSAAFSGVGQRRPSASLSTPAGSCVDLSGDDDGGGFIKKEALKRVSTTTTPPFSGI